MSIVARLEEHALRPEQELAALLEQASGDGAIVSFVGLARAAIDERRRPSTGWSSTIIRRLTQQSLEEIAVAAAQRFEVSHVRVVHRCGEVRCRRADRLRRGRIAASPRGLRGRRLSDGPAEDRGRLLEARGSATAGSEWIEPTDADYADRERWG